MDLESLEFRPFPKIPRLSRECCVSEKIDGTNASIWIDENGIIKAASRTRFITPQNDNFGFAKWVEQHTEELKVLGVGSHFGEWWGLGIQRGYDLFERRFSLFRLPKDLTNLPNCVSLVPVLYEGLFDTKMIEQTLMTLKEHGSKAAPGYFNPEGIVIYHKAAGIMFKKTVLNDEKPKGEQNV